MHNLIYIYIFINKMCFKIVKFDLYVTLQGKYATFIYVDYFKNV